MPGLTDATRDDGFVTFSNLIFRTADHIVIRDGFDLIGSIPKKGNKVKIFPLWKKTPNRNYFAVIQFDTNATYFSIIDLVKSEVILTNQVISVTGYNLGKPIVFDYEATFCKTYFYKFKFLAALIPIEVPFLTGGDYLISLPATYTGGNINFTFFVLSAGADTTKKEYWLESPRDVKIFQTGAAFLGWNVAEKTSGTVPPVITQKYHEGKVLFFGADNDRSTAANRFYVDLTYSGYAMFATPFALYVKHSNGLAAVFSDTLTSQGLRVNNANYSGAFVSYFPGDRSPIASIDGTFLLYSDIRTLRAKNISTPAFGSQAYLTGDSIAFPGYQNDIKILDTVTAESSALVLKDNHELLRCSIQSKGYGTETFISQSLATPFDLQAISINEVNGLEVYAFYDGNNVSIYQQNRSSMIDFARELPIIIVNEVNTVTIPSMFLKVGLNYVMILDGQAIFGTFTQEDINDGHLKLPQTNATEVTLGLPVEIVIEPVLWRAPSVILQCAYKEPVVVQNDMFFAPTKIVYSESEDQRNRNSEMTTEYYSIGESERFTLKGSINSSDIRKRFKIKMYPKKRFSIFGITFEGAKPSK